MKTPQRGEVWIADLGFVAKVRPVLILSTPSQDQDRSLVTAVPHTTSPRGSRFEVDLPLRFLKQGAFDAQNLISIPHAKLQRKVGELTTEQLADIEAAVKNWLGLR